MIHKLDMNLSAEQVWKEFAERIRQEDVEHFVVVFSTVKKSGGDSISVLKETAKMIGEKIETEREIQTMLAAKKLEFQIMCVLPLGMALYMRLTFSEFMSVLYGTIPGVTVMSICLGIYIAAYSLGRRMVQIEV